MKFKDYKDSIRIPLDEKTKNQIMMSARCNEAEFFAAADILDFQVRAGSNIKNYRKYLIAMIMAIRKGTLCIPNGYLPPWERAERARQEEAELKKEKAAQEQTAREVATERLSPEELWRLKEKNAPVLIASRSDDEDHEIFQWLMPGGMK